MYIIEFFEELLFLHSSTVNDRFVKVQNTRAQYVIYKIRLVLNVFYERNTNNAALYPYGNVEMEPYTCVAAPASCIIGHFLGSSPIII